MANTFMTTMKPCPFGYWDADIAFQSDADKIVTFVLRKLGEDVLSVELTKKEIWACFEEATLEFNALMIEYQAKSNLSSLLGSPTGSFNSQTGYSSINLTNTYVKPTLEFLVRQAEPYAAEVGYGGTTDTYSGSLVLSGGKQDYDLYTELVDASGTPLASLMPSGASGKMKIHEVFHQAPSMYAYNSTIQSTMAAAGLPMETYVPDTRFHVLPVFEDVLRASMFETSARIRRSHYSYRISGRYLRIFPIPSNNNMSTNRLYIRMSYPQSPAPGLFFTDVLTSSATPGNGNINVMQTFNDSTIYGISNPANVPYGLIDYKTLNPWARNWIYQWTLCLAKELLGLTRSKIKSIPFLNTNLDLNGEALLSQAREDKTRLMIGEGGILTKLGSLTYDKLAEIEANKAELLMKQLKFLPMPPSHLCRMG